MEKDRVNENSRPFFSVIISTYNRAILLMRALNSLISQTDEDWEAIVVDDESTDHTHIQILPLLRAYPKIKYINRFHGGEAFAKNTGIYSATGRYITFLDSDDEFESGHLASRKAILIQNPSTKFLYGGVKIIGNQYVPDRYDYKKIVDLNDCVIGGTFMIDREVVLSLNGFRYILVGCDADFFDRAKEEGVAMMEVHQPTYIYHHETEDSITNRLLQSK